MCEQRTLRLSNGYIVYCYADGRIEHTVRRGNKIFLIEAKPNLRKDGYLRVSINKKDYSVHRLIALAFCENPFNRQEVDHIDRNKLNNAASNLRWSSREENMLNREDAWKYHNCLSIVEQMKKGVANA